jgi:hypothetical protein
VALAVSVLVASAASACGRSQRTPEPGGGGDAGSAGFAAAGASAAGTADAGQVGAGGGAGSSSVGGSGVGGSGVGGSGVGGSGVGGSSAGGAGATAGGSGEAGAPLTDADVCADACAQTRHPLPNALCEDWQFPDHEYVAEYCVPVSSSDCAGRCEEQLGAVSAACNAALHHAIPCVARTDLYQNGGIHFDCLFQECTRLLLDVSAECNGLRQELAAARERWQAAGSDSYSFTLTAGVSVATIVVTDGEASVVEGTLTDPPTIPALFDRLEDSLEFIPASATYDPALGYPVEAHTPAPGCAPPEAGFSFAVTDVVLE